MTMAHFPALVSLALVCLLAAVPSEAFVRSNLGPQSCTIQHNKITTCFHSTTSDLLTDDEKIVTMFKKLKISSPFMKQPEFDTSTCNLAMLRLANSDVRDKGEPARQLLQYMLDQSCAAGREELRPDLRTLNTMLSAFSKSAAPFSARNAQLADEMFEEWRVLFHKGIVDEDVDLFSYNTLLSAHIRARDMARAEEVFADLKGNVDRNTEEDDSRPLPDTVSYGTMMRGYALQKGQVSKAEALFQEMQVSSYLQPSVECFNELLYAFSKSNVPAQAYECLQLWLGKTDDLPFQPNVRSFNIALHAMSRDDRPGTVIQAERLFAEMSERDNVSYTTIIALYCDRLSGDVAIGATQRAITSAWEDPNVKMTSQMIANFLYSLSTVDSKEMPTRAERLVATAKKRNVRLDIGVYNALIYCWAKSGDYEAARRARQILTTIEKQPRLRPNLKTYTNVLDCFAKSREQVSLDFAAKVIEKMERNGPRPNVHSYTSLIQNYARSRLPYKAQEAFRVLQRMKKLDDTEARPNIVTFNAVLNAAEHSDTSGGAVTEGALKVAFLVFDEIRTSSVVANHVTYGTFIGVLGKLMPSTSRKEIVELVWRRACKEGQVSPLVLRKLEQAVDTREQFLTLLSGYDEDSIPSDWKANVQEVKARETT